MNNCEFMNNYAKVAHFVRQENSQNMKRFVMKIVILKAFNNNQVRAFNNNPRGNIR